MIFYLLLFIIISVLIVCKSNNGVIISFLLLTFLYGLRNDGGVDDFNYISNFNDVINNISLPRREVTFAFFAKTINAIGMNYKGLFMLYAAISFYFLYQCYKQLCENKRDWLIAIIGFLCFSFIETITIMRQFAAAAIVCYALSIFYNDKSMKPFLLVVIAALFHLPAIITLLFMPILKIKYSGFIKALLPILCLFIGYSGLLNVIINLLSFLIPKGYEVYLQTHTTPRVGTLNTLLFIIFVVSLLMPKVQEINYYKRGIFVYAHSNSFYIENLITVYFCIYFIALSSHWLTRFASYYRLFLPFILIGFINKAQVYFDRKLLNRTVFIAQTALYVYVIVGIQFGMNTALIPYKASLNFFR